MEQHLTHRDYRLIAVCFVVAVLSLVTASHFFYDAFPEATIDFRITREEAGERARTFLDSRGLDVERYRHSAIFLFDGSAKTFLERELGLEGATALIGDPVRLWRWSNRWVRELEKEEFRVQYTTAGELAGFSHLIEEEAAGASLDQAEARSLAEGFLSGTMGRDLAGLTFVEAEITERPNRSDHTFTWKLSGFEVSEATYRLKVGIQGDQVGGYSESLKVPEAWQREYQELRSYNEATGLVAAVLMVLLWIGMLVVLTQSIRARDVRWKTVTVFTAIAFALTFLAQLNTLPLTEFNFDTTETYGSFLTGHLLSALLSALGQAVLIGFLTAGAEPIYRRSYGGQISLNQQFLPAGIRTKRFLTGTVIGLTMTALFVAYQTVFYVVADDLGAWSPAQIPYDQMVNTYIPWVVVLLIGFMPAVSEEFTSRAFSIPFLQRFLKKRWLAVVISALVWGFAHAGYPQQPFYIRGIEVGLAGIAVGYVMIRWGLLPALVWHYTIDAFYTAMILLRSSNSYFVVSAGLSVGLMLLPFAAALVLYVRHRFFVDPEPLLNRAESPPLGKLQEALSGEAAPAPASRRGFRHWSRHRGTPPCRGAGFSSRSRSSPLAAGIFLIDYDKPLKKETVFAVTAQEAEAAARTYLGDRGVDLEEYRVVVTGSSAASGSVAKYRMERAGFAAIDSLYSHHLPLNRWRVRFFRSLEKEEFHVYVDCGDGSVDSFTHLVEEEAAGADLSEEEARAVAEAHLREFGVDAGEFELVESSSEKMKARRDHNFVWEALDGDPRNLDESFYRIEVDVIGDEASGFRRFVKLPEEWLREREESTTLKAAMSGLQIVVIVARRPAPDLAADPADAVAGPRLAATGDSRPDRRRPVSHRLPQQPAGVLRRVQHRHGDLDLHHHAGRRRGAGPDRRRPRCGLLSRPGRFPVPGLPRAPAGTGAGRVLSRRRLDRPARLGRREGRGSARRPRCPAIPRVRRSRLWPPVADRNERRGAGRQRPDRHPDHRGRDADRLRHRPLLRAEGPEETCVRDGGGPRLAPDLGRGGIQRRRVPPRRRNERHQNSDRRCRHRLPAARQHRRLHPPRGADRHPGPGPGSRAPARHLVPGSRMDLARHRRRFDRRLLDRVAAPPFATGPLIRFPPGRGMRVLITGAAGAVGSTLVAGLKGRYELRGLDLVEVPGLDAGDVVIGDLSDYEVALQATRGMEAVIHLAGNPGGSATWEQVLQNNITGTYNLFEASRQNGVRRVAFASRAGLLGAYPKSLQRTMDLVPLPQNYYTISKAFGEQIGYMYATRFDMEVVSVRIGNFNRDRDLPEHPHHLSHGDCVRVFERAIVHPGVRYEVVFGVSDSNWPMYDLDHGRKVLGYEPRDRSVVPQEEWDT